MKPIAPKEPRKPLSPAMCALIESGQVEDGDADLLEPQGQALPELPKGWPNSHPYSYTADDMHTYARAYASQLALPAAQPLIGAGHFTMDASGRWAEVDRNAPNSTILYHGPEWPQENTDPFSHEERIAADVKYQMMKTSYEAEIKQLREQLALPAGPGAVMPTGYVAKKHPDGQSWIVQDSTGFVFTAHAGTPAGNLVSALMNISVPPTEVSELVGNIIQSARDISHARNEPALKNSFQRLSAAVSTIGIKINPTSPAVAQPVVSPPDVAWQIRSDPDAEWTCAFDKKDADDRVRLHGWEMRSLGVIAASQEAVAQPVADEREIIDMARMFSSDNKYCAGAFVSAEFSRGDILRFARALQARAALGQPAEEGGKS